MKTKDFYLAVTALYPDVDRIVGETAYDIGGNEVLLNMDEIESYVQAHQYVELRAAEYPPITDYIDGVVKGDQAQIDAYIAACQAVKAKYPKP